MRSAVIIDADEWQSLKDTVTFLATEVRELRTRPSGDALAPLRPREVAKRYHVRADSVYAALTSGHLPGTRRAGRGGIETWLVDAKDAHTWWQTFVRGASNQ